MYRSAVDYGLKEAVVQDIRSRIDRPRFLSGITEHLSNARIQEIGAGHELGEERESFRVPAWQFRDESSGVASTGGGDHALESVRQIRAERKHLIETLVCHAGIARTREACPRRNQDIGEPGENGTSLGINIHTGTF
jgi:hypothetical protein